MQSGWAFNMSHIVLLNFINSKGKKTTVIGTFHMLKIMVKRYDNCWLEFPVELGG